MHFHISFIVEILHVHAQPTKLNSLLKAGFFGGTAGPPVWQKIDQSPYILI